MSKEKRKKQSKLKCHEPEMSNAVGNLDVTNEPLDGGLSKKHKTMKKKNSDKGSEKDHINSITDSAIDNSTTVEALVAQEKLSECPSLKKHKKKKRKKSINEYCEETENDNVFAGPGDSTTNAVELQLANEQSENHTSTKLKKKKRKKSINECFEETENNNVFGGPGDSTTNAVELQLANEQSDNHTSTKHKKKKKRKSITGTEFCEEMSLSNISEVFKDDSTNETKKRKKTKVEAEFNTNESHCLESTLESSKTRKHKNTSKNLSEPVSNEVFDDHNSKKRKKTKELPTVIDNEIESQVISIQEASKKSKKHAGNKRECDSQLDDKHKPKKIIPTPEVISKSDPDEESCNRENNNEQCKKKKKSSDVAQSSSKEIKKKKHKETSENSPTNQSENVGADAKKTAEEKVSVNSTSVQGQWKGDLFNNEERQNKFLRLMGGMKKDPSGQSKKGLYGSLASLCNKTGPESKGNVAMSTTASAELSKKLEDEYNKALNFKLSGKIGTGFGFTPDPAEGKKFHIDINKTKSIKFDD